MYLYSRRLFAFAFATLMTLAWSLTPAGITNSPHPLQAIINNNLSTPLQATLAVEPIPLVDEAATITCTVTSLVDAPDTQVQFILPEDAEVLEGSTDWTGDILANTPVDISVKIIFHAEGKHEVSCKVIKAVSETETWSDWPVFYMTLGSQTSQVGYPYVRPEEGVIQAKMSTPGEGLQIPNKPMVFPSIDLQDEALKFDIDQLAPPSDLQTIVAAGSLTITGEFHYYNRTDQWTGTSGLLVRVFNADTGADLAYCYTDGNGAYTCGPFTNPGSAGVRACVMSFASINFDQNEITDIVAVVNPAWGTTPEFDNVYTICTNTQTFADGTRNIGSWFVGNGVADEQAFWMERDLLDLYLFIWINGSDYQSTPITAGPVTLEWQDGLSPPPGNGTAYYTNHGNIHIFGTQTSGVSVVHHEYGHAIMHNVYGVDYDAQREACTGTNTYQAARNDGCAWNEGWATFLDLAVRNNSFYRWADGGVLDMEPPTWGSTDWPNDGMTVTGRVTGALWDMYDDVNDGADEYYYAFWPMWNTYTFFSAHNISNFYANWSTQGYPMLGPAMSIYHNTIDLRISPPGAFSKGSPADFATGQPSTVTLSWTASSGATSYAYCFDTINNDTCDSSWINVGTSLSANISVPSPSTTYYWHVRSVASNSHTYAGGNDTYYREFTTGSLPGAFPKFTPADTATNQAINLALDWSNSSNATSYAYCLVRLADAPCTSWVSTGVNTTINLTNLLPGTTYQWQARATNSSGSTTADAGPWTFTTHASIPSANSIVRANVSPTSAASVSYTVSFSETVTGTTTSDFSLTTSGLTGASITSVNGSGATRTVVVNTGSGSGTLRLNIPGSATIMDMYGIPVNNIPYTSGQVYVIGDIFLYLPLIVR